MKRFGLSSAEKKSDLQVLHQMQGRIMIKTHCKSFNEISEQVNHWLATSHVDQGLLTVFVCHTSASLVIQENADVTVQYDLLDALDRLAPESPDYRHNNEGPDDMPGHIKAMLTSTSLAIPVDNGKPVLGQWQGLYLVEHRDTGNERQVVLQYQGTLHDVQD